MSDEERLRELEARTDVLMTRIATLGWLVAISNGFLILLMWRSFK